jgi:DNA-binding LacI/PurR family transcriptional regulator
VVGFDDLRLARFMAPPLTTVRQPAGEIARHSTELLLGMIAGKKPRESRHLFVPELIIRSSTSPPP